MKLSYLSRLAALCLIYFLTALLGLKIDAFSQVATLLWPPTGISLAAVLVFGNRMWPAIMLGAFSVNLWITKSPWIAGGICIGNTLEALVGAYLLKRVVKIHYELDRVTDVLALIGLAALFSTLISAGMGVTSGWMGGIVSPEHFLFTFLVWWFGDIAGNIIIAPALLVWSGKVPTRKGGSRVELVIFSAFILVASWFVFVVGKMPALGLSLQPYTIFPLLVWSCFRFGQRGVVITILIVSFASVFGVLYGHSFFQEQTVTLRLFQLQLFLVLITSRTILSTEFLSSVWFMTRNSS